MSRTEPGAFHFSLFLGKYELRLAEAQADREAACRLIIEDRSRREIVGTYRMQSGQTASNNLGYYSEQEFNFARKGGGYAEPDEASFQLSALRFTLW